FRRSGRLKGKGLVVEENTIEDAIDVDEYVSEDENVSQDEGNEHIIGTQVDNKDVGPSTSGVDILDVDIVKDEEIIKIWKDQYGTNKVKPNDVKYMIRKSKVAVMNFKLNFIVLFTSIMGGVKTKGYCDLSVLDHINIKIKSEGLGKGELAGPYVEGEDDPMPDNLENVLPAHLLDKKHIYGPCIEESKSACSGNGHNTATCKGCSACGKLDECDNEDEFDDEDEGDTEDELTDEDEVDEEYESNEE
nr:hypothetical protein [Tanacetum cinerariifolium]